MKKLVFIIFGLLLLPALSFLAFMSLRAIYTIDILSFTIISAILWILIIKLVFSLKRALETFAVSEILEDVDSAVYVMGEVLKAPLKNISSAMLSKMKKVLKSLLGNVVKLYKDNVRKFSIAVSVLLCQITALIIIALYFASNAVVSLDFAICVFLLINSIWVIEERKMKFGDLKYLGVFMTPIILIYLTLNLIPAIIRMPESPMGWVILIVFLLIALPLSFFIGIVLAWIAFVIDLAFRFLYGEKGDELHLQKQNLSGTTQT